MIFLLKIDYVCKNQSMLSTENIEYLYIIYKNELLINSINKLIVVSDIFHTSKIIGLLSSIPPTEFWRYYPIYYIFLTK